MNVDTFEGGRYVRASDYDALARELADAREARSYEEWHEGDGPVLWWSFPVNEPPYVGTPMDDEWPFYHTHWTRIVVPIDAAMKEGER
jgi:hypothetical protein